MSARFTSLMLTSLAVVFILRPEIPHAAPEDLPGLLQRVNALEAQLTATQAALDAEITARIAADTALAAKDMALMDTDAALAAKDMALMDADAALAAKIESIVAGEVSQDELDAAVARRPCAWRAMRRCSPARRRTPTPRLTSRSPPGRRGTRRR